MGLNTLAVILLLLLSIWWLMRKRRASQDDAHTPVFRPRKKQTAYHAVSIKFRENACDAAKAMAGRRFLATAAPTLPLRDCDSLDCKCHFAHHDDRRSGQDRRSPFSPGQTIAGTGSYDVEKRKGEDRRNRGGD